MIVMGVLVLVGIGAALCLGAANRRQADDTLAATVAAAAAAKDYYRNPVFLKPGARATDRTNLKLFSPPCQNQSILPGSSARATARMQTIPSSYCAFNFRALMRTSTALIRYNPFFFLLPHHRYASYAEISSVQKTTALALVANDSDGYVVDDFNPDDFGRRHPTMINVDSNQTIYAIPVAQDEPVAVAANTNDYLVPAVVGEDYEYGSAIQAASESVVQAHEHGQPNATVHARQTQGGGGSDERSGNLEEVC